jgi:uncharacterized protein (TIGR04255 family)
VAHYPKAPITEALIDLQVRLPAAITSETLRDVRGAREAQFPSASELKRAYIEFRVGEGQAATGTAEQAGWIFRSSDDKRVAQARLDGFTFSRLAPYDRWETLRAEAQEFWSDYRRVASPEAITRVGIRYINRFDLPLPFADLKDFFRTTPEVSPAMPQELAGFFMQLQVPYPDLQAMLVLTQTLVPPPQIDVASVVLDIGFSCANNVPQEDTAIWHLLEQFRVKKNEVFEACITDAARELIR